MSTEEEEEAGGMVVGPLQPMDLGQIDSEGGPAVLLRNNSMSGSCGNSGMSIGASAEGTVRGMMVPGNDDSGHGEAAGLEVVQCIQQKRRR